jgi:hypothetical protein
MRSFIVFFTAVIICCCYGAPTRIDDEDYRNGTSSVNSTTIDTDSVNGTDSLNGTESNSTTTTSPKIVEDQIAAPDYAAITTVSKNATVCPNGWVVYESSCYFVGRTVKSFQQANVYCQSLGGSLITIDSPDEWETMRNHMQRVQWTWIGLNAQGSLLEPTWIKPSSFNPESLPWLVASTGHGATPLINCAAYYAATDMASSYVNFYDCSLKYYFMCENNSTLSGKYTSAKKAIGGVRSLKTHVVA